MEEELASHKVYTLL